MAQVSLSSFQLVDSNGHFHVADLNRFVRVTGLANYGVNYSIVAIVGSQSSGKSTLLNHLYGTNFTQMDAEEGWSRTTQGIWMEKGDVSNPFTIAMDIEGTDGSERGEDDTAFEKQSALFALAIADVVLINMWCHDINREHAANMPLLKLVFEVMVRLFHQRKTTLLFVLRDKTKTPLQKLVPTLRQRIQKIWDEVPKPEAHKMTPLSEFFNVEVTALSNYEEKEQEFKEQVAELKEQISHSISKGLAADKRVPGSGFSLSVQRIWKDIKENKDLNLPAHKVMVATVRCEEIANEKLRCLFADKDWLDLVAALKVGRVEAFSKRLSFTHLSEYDRETVYYDEGVRTAKRQLLLSEALTALERAYNPPIPASAQASAPTSIITTAVPVAGVIMQVAGVIMQVAGFFANLFS